EAMLFLINHNLLRYESPRDGIPFFSFTAISNDPARERIEETLGNRVVLNIFEIDDSLLNPLEEVAVLAFAKSLSFRDVYAVFGQYMKSTVDSEEIRKHVLDIRRRRNAANAWINLERIVPILDRLDVKLSKKLPK